MALLSEHHHVAIDDRRHLSVRVDGEKFRLELVALAGVDRDGVVGNSGLLEEQGDLGRIGRAVEIELEHGVVRFSIEEEVLRLIPSSFAAVPPRSQPTKARPAAEPRNSRRFVIEVLLREDCTARLERTIRVVSPWMRKMVALALVASRRRTRMHRPTRTSTSRCTWATGPVRPLT